MYTLHFYCCVALQFGRSQYGFHCGFASFFFFFLLHGDDVDNDDDSDGDDGDDGDDVNVGSLVTF